MAHTDLFKPFTDPRLGSLFFKKDMSENFLIEVAQKECQSIYPGIMFPDAMVVVGCGRTKRPATASIASNDTKRTKGSKWTRSEADEIKSCFSEDSSETYAHYPRPNFISLNPIIDDLPDLDDVASMVQLQHLIREATDSGVITRLVAQLFATLFYAETDDPLQDTSAGEVLIPGNRLVGYSR